ncbi:MBOAT family O-acyltransferase [Polaribacter sp.]|uniref:MBOAT family O-acyltransferase n=1 Tax=Polaribacter sp. TaxID=1920175 RepID=UPI003F6B33CE
MIFNSIDFALFLPIVFVLYWFLANKNLKLQNLLVVISSYVFYGWWDWKFLILILFSTIVDYFVGIELLKQENLRKRKYLLLVSVIVNLGLLGFFKYYNFFLENFNAAFSFFGAEIKVSSLNIILPVGISFYTFQTLSYSIDVYKKKLKPTKDFIAFSAFVSFFPQLVAGPIERAKDLLPQFYTKRTFDYSKAVDGMRQILWGLFKKMVIADNCAMFANQIFNNSDDFTGSTLVLGALFFTFQIYGDFSGYSDIAIGTSRLFGFNLTQNFAFPYFSRDFAEFWRKWHISLTKWFRDYLFIPMARLNKNKKKSWKIIIVFIQFIIIGLWHGANWTYVVWGIVNAMLFIPTLLKKGKQKNIGTIAKGRIIPSPKEFFNLFSTFSLFVFSIIFFRAESLKHAISYLSNIFSLSLFSVPNFTGKKTALITLFLTLLFFLIEWFGRNDKYGIEKLGYNWKAPVRLTVYYIIIFIIFIFKGKTQEFIYFQF